MEVRWILGVAVENRAEEGQLVHPARVQLVEIQAEELQLGNWDVFFVPWHLPAVAEIMAIFVVHPVFPAPSVEAGTLLVEVATLE